MRFSVLCVVLLVAVGLVCGGFFAYCPVRVAVEVVEPPIVFYGGNNANASGLSGQLVQVYIGCGGASANVTVHAAARASYYVDVLRVFNRGNAGYNVYLRVVEALRGLPACGCIYLYGEGAERVFAGWPAPAPEGYLDELSLTDEGTAGPILLGPRETIEVDLHVYSPIGAELPTTLSRARLILIYTPSGEEPP
ncbi:MAG: hypothetical protein QFX33_02520 [Candidatus Nezhaarchaeota archaeon]|nr:hypothetical protein [Candidatus Nezhaarchaeota archaeon]